jgi:hypothetical protein
LQECIGTRDTNRPSDSMQLPSVQEKFRHD